MPEYPVINGICNCCHSTTEPVYRLHLCLDCHTEWVMMLDALDQQE